MGLMTIKSAASQLNAYLPVRADQPGSQKTPSATPAQPNRGEHYWYIVIFHAVRLSKRQSRQ
jgi:hypothetical protein